MKDGESRMPDIECEVGHVSSCLIWVSPKANIETRTLMQIVNLRSDSRKLSGSEESDPGKEAKQ